MRLKRLILENIGVFVNKNEFDFESTKPIVLIGGMNGRGKTTILESVLLALYGKRSGNLIGNHQKFEKYLEKISNLNGEEKLCLVELEFQVSESQEELVYRVQRSWNIKTKKIKLDTKVWKNNERDYALSSSWDLFIEEILPHAVAPFFFFDGEKISELASSENEEQISSSIKSLLGVDIIERLIKDLKTMESQKVKVIKENGYSKDLQAQETKIKDNIEQYQRLVEELRKAKYEYTYTDKELEELEDKYVVAGGEFALYKADIEKRREQAVIQKENIDSQLLEMAAGNLPLKMVDDLLEDILQASELEKEEKEIEIFLRKGKGLYEEYKKIDEKSHFNDFFSYVESKKNHTSIVYNLDGETQYRLKNIGDICDLESDRVKSLLKEKKILDEKIENLETYLQIKVDDEVIDNLFEKIKTKTASKAILGERIAKYEEELEILENKRTGLEQGRLHLLEKVVEDLENVDEAKREIRYIQQEIRILDAYKLKLQSMKVGMLSRKMTECLKRLIAKDGLIDKIILDSKTLTFTYYNKKNQKIDKMSLSAGEKQLLVIAMLWALGICANTAFPLIIDTPLARLDSVHRKSLISNYFPFASEQVIILSTDQEIAEGDYAVLKKYIGKEYTLLYHEATMSSTVEEGYFGRTEK